jgi:predicted nucleic-acid-binding protein
MIGVDTNVLLRLIVRDDLSQHELARNFFALRSASDPAYVSILVLTECAWLLRKRYGYTKDRIADMVAALLESPDIVIEQADLVADAAERSRQPKVGLVDALIAQLASRQGCSATCTFDRDAAKLVPGMELLA